MQGSNAGQARWSAQDSARSPGAPDCLCAVCFPDPSHGWAVGDEGDDGTIVATADGGATWSVQHAVTKKLLWGVSFPDASHGWAVGEDGTILATADGGATWNAQDSGTEHWLTAVCFLDVGVR